MRKSCPSDIKREPFAWIRPLLESAGRKTALRKVDLYKVFCAVLYLLRIGSPWRGLPSDFPKCEGFGAGRVKAAAYLRRC